MKTLSDIQAKLKAPKGQFNNFGKYKYRSCEDIVEAVKPILAEHGAVLLLSDEIAHIGDRYYVRATAQIVGDDWHAEAVAYAREPEDKKGMDGSQITGTASSYARKYALNGLLAIDDTKDADTDEHGKQTGEPDDTPRGVLAQKVKKEKAQMYQENIIVCLPNDDLGVRELWDEMGRDYQEWIWPNLSSKQQQAVRSALNNTKEAT